MSDAETEQCPWCAETIKGAAIVCRYCGRDLPVVVSGRAPWRGGNESVGVIVDVGVAARQLASSSLVLGPTSFVSSASLSIS